MASDVNNVVVILGMQRSGTSALAGCLKLLGVDLGDLFVPADPNNPYGFFEHLDLYAIHENLLLSLGSSWDTVGTLPHDWLSSAAVEQALSQMEQIVTTQFLGKKVWGIKDPRICRILPLWSLLFKKLSIQPNYIFIVRDPIEVALSLDKRNKMDAAKSCLLWAAHNIEAIQGMKNAPYAIVTYDQLLSDPIGLFQSINKRFGNSLLNTSEEALANVSQFIQPRLKHNHAKQAFEKTFDFTPYSALYALLQQRAILSRERVFSTDQNKDACAQSTPSQDDAIIFESISIAQDMLSVIGTYEREARKQHHLERVQHALAANSAKVLVFQVYYPTPTEPEAIIEEKNFYAEYLIPEDWKKIEIDIPRPQRLRKEKLRIDPVNQHATVSIMALDLINSFSGETLWEACDATQFSTIEINSDVIISSLENAFSFFAIGMDPQLHLPLFPELPDVPVRLRTWIKVSRGLHSLPMMVKQLIYKNEILKL